MHVSWNRVKRVGRIFFIWNYFSPEKSRKKTVKGKKKKKSGSPKSQTPAI
jgi:hypothetical protein